MNNTLELNWKIITGCTLAIILILAMVVSVPFSCRASEATLPVPVRVSVAEPVAGVTGLRYSANIIPRRQVELAFKVGGYVHEIASLPGPDGISRDVRAGDRVKQGMVLSRLDTKDYTVRASQARASLEEAKASLSMAQKDYERNQSLVKGGYVAKSDFDRKQESLDVADARVDVALAQLDQANNQLADSVLKSPLDGVVVNRFVERGTLVASGTRAFVLVDLSAVKAVFGVPDSLLSRIKTGEALSVVVDALNHRQFKGIVTAVSPSADSKSRVFDVEVTIQNSDGALKDGMIATVHVENMNESDHLPAQSTGQTFTGITSVPLQSVVRPPDDPSGYMVFVASEKNGQWFALARRVELGDVAGRSVKVLQGIAPGERVITAGATIVHDGALLTIVP
ncbi:MAG: efflux RND transporter periplasmic adaptor subunit [Deltaproteobacteria bacterium]|nr:efflux RND transporter periplasmic adaptor subunit [Deltaproteobacteria bacterium]